MLEGICHQCKVHYHGQALNIRRNQTCLRCGRDLEVRNNGVLLHTAFYLFQTEKYRISDTHEEWEDLCAKNLLFYVTFN